MSVHFALLSLISVVASQKDEEKANCEKTLVKSKLSWSWRLTFDCWNDWLLRPIFPDHFAFSQTWTTFAELNYVGYTVINSVICLSPCAPCPRPWEMNSWWASPHCRPTASQMQHPLSGSCFQLPSVFCCFACSTVDAKDCGDALPSCYREWRQYQEPLQLLLPPSSLVQ